MDQIKEHILNFREPLDSKLLDQLLLIAMDPHHPQRLKADQLLVSYVFYLYNFVIFFNFYSIKD